MWHIVLSLFVIPVAVWILSSLFRVGEDERQGNRPRANPRNGGPNASRPRRPPNDIDSFLEEVNRRRREGAERSRTASPEKVPPPPAVRPRMPPARPEAVRRRPMPPTVVPATAGTAARQPPRDLPQAVEVVVVDPNAPSAPGKQPLRTALSATVGTPAGPVPLPHLQTPGTIAPKPVSSVLQQLLPLLRSPQTLRTAVLIQEIFGPPRYRALHGRAAAQRTISSGDRKPGFGDAYGVPGAAPEAPGDPVTNGAE